MKSIKVCEYSRSRSFHDDLILQDQASGERSQDQWSSGNTLLFFVDKNAKDSRILSNKQQPKKCICLRSRHLLNKFRP